MSSKMSTANKTEEAKDFRQFLCFRLGNRGFAVDVMNVREIVRASDIVRDTPLEGSPSYEMSHGGQQIRIFDLRAVFHLGEPVLDDSTRVIFVDPDQRQFGMMVDGVSEIVRVRSSEVKTSQTSSDKMKAVFPEQVAVGGRAVLCLDPTQLSPSRQPKDK